MIDSGLAVTAPVRSWARIAFGGISHETNTFACFPTTLADFQRRTFLTGAALLHHARGSSTALGGIINAAEHAGFTPQPTLFASAMPGGMVNHATFTTLLDELLHRLDGAMRGPAPVAGVVLVLHGAMVTEGDPNPDATIAQRVRETLGDQLSIVAICDSHANLTPELVGAVDIPLTYQTYPHVDTVTRGEEAVAHLLALRDGRLKLTTALRQIPLLAPLPPQATTGATPMADIMALARQLRREPGIVHIAIAGGFPYADVPQAGMSVLVTSNGDDGLANETADRLAAAIWDRRERFQTHGLRPKDALERAAKLTRAGIPGPVVLADVGDNPGAGAPGDDTTLLSALLNHASSLGLTGAAVAAIPDPYAVTAAIASGLDTTVQLTLGGNNDSATRQPIERAWRVKAISDGRFINSGPMGKGSPTRLGQTVLLHADGVDVIVCECRVQALDPEIFRLVGIEPTQRPLLAIKSGVHFRAAFEPLAAAVLEVETPGLSRSDLRSFPYRYVRRPISPLNEEVRYLD